MTRQFSGHIDRTPEDQPVRTPRHPAQKYDIGDEVYYDGRKCYVSGVRARICYDVVLFEYEVAAGLYGDYGPERWGGRCDFEMHDRLRAEQLRSPAEFVMSRKAELLEQIEAAEQELQRLREKAADLAKEGA